MRKIRSVSLSLAALGVLGLSTSSPVFAEDAVASFRMPVSDVFEIPNRGVVLLGKIEKGSVAVGDKLSLTSSSGARVVTVKSIEKFEKKGLTTAEAGPDDVGLGLADIAKADVASGSTLEKK